MQRAEEDAADQIRDAQRDQEDGRGLNPKGGMSLERVEEIAHVAASL